MEQSQAEEGDASDDDPFADLSIEDALTGVAPGLSDHDPTRGLGLDGFGFEDNLDGVEDEMDLGESLEGLEDEMGFGESLEGTEDEMDFGESLEGTEDVGALDEVSGEDLGGYDDEPSCFSCLE